MSISSGSVGEPEASDTADVVTPETALAEIYGLDAEEQEPSPERAPATFERFAPHPLGGYDERFRALVHRLEGARQRPAARSAVDTEIAWAQAQRDEFRAQVAEASVPVSLRRYVAALSVLADLLAQEWKWRVRAKQIELAPPDFTSSPRNPSEVLRQKAAIQGAMRPDRIAQLQEQSVQRFLQDMECPRAASGGREVSVLDLVADGDALARDLRRVVRGKAPPNAEQLRQVIDPYLQLADSDLCCETTGLRLADIWRYFRYHWSIKQFSTPGRNIFYLVRDRARPFHPVIGIAALGNSIVRLSKRDEWIGWSPDAVSAYVSDPSVSDAERAARRARTARVLYEAVEHAIEQINPDGLVSDAERATPSEAVVTRLLSSARESARQRVETLRAHERDLSGARSGARKPPKRSRPLEPSKVMLAAAAGEAPRSRADQGLEQLYRYKRASQLAELLRARLAFTRAGVEKDPGGALVAMLGDEEGYRAVSFAVQTVKREHVGNSIMDVIICGAIPPYTHLLGGKLVCMLLASGEVQFHYRDRYENQPSEIASFMKGALRVKPADLVFLGTTSLYHVGSSQYNRVKIPAALAGGAGAVRYERLGETRGYGSVHYSARSRDLLGEIVRAEKGAKLITHSFGEGTNPKLRLLREGLTVLGLNQDHFLRHQCRRIVYGVALARNAREYLRNETQTPDYFFPNRTQEEGSACSRAIAAHWSERWLAMRARNDDVLARVARFSRAELKMTAHAAPRGADVLRGEPPKDGAVATRHGPPRRPPGAISVEFIQRLYNHRSCYADRLSDEQLAAIHVETPLEQFVEDALRRGQDVVLTGNPGDGKTHVLRRLMPRLHDVRAEFHLDATAEDAYASIVEAWRRAHRRSRPFCIAINEWPLIEMVRDFAADFAPLREVRAQLNRSVVYSDAPATGAKVVVVDLNNRDVVDPAVIRRLVATLTDERFYPECPTCPARDSCDVPRARRGLAHERVQSRLASLLELVAKSGHHATMRDLQGFLSYLVTGGRTCAQLMSAREPRPYFDLAWSGESALFDALRSVFDPARATHPVYDEALWSGRAAPDGWLTGDAGPPPAHSPNDPAEAMRSLKRRFFFEHRDGDQLLRLLPPDERRFYEALELAPTDGPSVVREIVRLLNRFFDPKDATDATLRIWCRHRFDARWSPAYVSVREVPADSLRLLVPQLPRTLKPAFAYQPDHLVLAAEVGGERAATLRVDLALFRTLHDARRGLPMALRSPEVLKRIDLFFDAVGRAVRAPRGIEDVRIKNFESGLELRFKVDRRRSRYLL